MSTSLDEGSLGHDAAAFPPGAFAGSSIGVEAAFAGYAPGQGGSVMVNGASMSVEAAFAAYAPAGGSVGLAAGGNGPSISVDAALANGWLPGHFNGSSIGVEAAFAAAAPPNGGVSLMLDALGLDASQLPPGFDGSSLFVEAAFANPGPRRASGASCMVGAGASMAVEGAFSEVAPEGEVGSSSASPVFQSIEPAAKASTLPCPQQQPSALAAMYAASEAAQAAKARGSSSQASEDNAPRTPTVSTPRRRQQRLAASTLPPRWPQVQAVPLQPPRRPVQRFPLAAESSSATVPVEMVRRRPGMSLFRSSASPIRGGTPSMLPMARPMEDSASYSDAARASPLPMSTAVEVTAMPYAFNSPDLRFEAPIMVFAATPASAADPLPPRNLLDDNQFVGSSVREPSYVPRGPATVYDPTPAVTNVTSGPGLSLKEMAFGQSVTYPGPTRGNTVQFTTTGNTVQFSAAPMPMPPIQVDVHMPAAASGVPRREAPQTQLSRPILHYTNGSAGRYAQPMQAVPAMPTTATLPYTKSIPTAQAKAAAAPTPAKPSTKTGTANFFSPAPYVRPSQPTGHMPSYTAPIVTGLAQGQAYSLQPPVLTGQSMGFPVGPPPLPFSNMQKFGVREASVAPGKSLMAPSREGVAPKRGRHPAVAVL